ncbi:hypothetical protein PIB30_015292 [Stylosanthes scabra]|uniref:Uncharacterized protein n=1 Tax=Stylosanthes scabra TaxID=79078 RepID=A0ABU6Z3S4_9FABA|nr:hypothetical protein [Stylosanthes scabra]
MPKTVTTKNDLHSWVRLWTRLIREGTLKICILGVSKPKETGQLHNHSSNRRPYTLAANASSQSSSCHLLVPCRRQLVSTGKIRHRAVHRTLNLHTHNRRLSVAVLPPSCRRVVVRALLRRVVRSVIPTSVIPSPSRRRASPGTDL